MAVDVCYVLNDGFPARMILHSNILPELHERGVSVALVVPNANEALMQEMAKRHDVSLFEAPNIRSRLTNEYEWLIRRYLFEDVLTNPSLRSWHLKLKDMPEHRIRNRVRAGVYLSMNRLSQRSQRFRHMLERMEKHIFLDNPVVGSLIASINPRLLVSTYPVSILEAAFLHEAGKAGIPTVSQLLSWDNITSKGRFSVVSDFFLTWGPIMSEELAQYYAVSPSRIFECGVAHFDQHVRAVAPGKADEILTEIGLDPDRPFLLFGMSSSSVSPKEIEVVEWLAKELRRGAFGADLQLIVRPHPQNMQGYTADESWLARLRDVAGGPVVIDYPALQQSAMAWNLSEDDLPRLVNLLASSRIVLNSGSTLAIDGVIHDKPVILTLFDGAAELPWHRSIRRYREVIHMRKLIDLQGVRVAGSFEELRRLITDYLADPTLDASGRARTRQEECGRIDGHACERIADVLSDLVKRRQAVAVPETADIHD